MSKEAHQTKTEWMIRRTVISILIGMAALTGFAQEHDLESWIGASLKFELSKRFDLEVDQQFRLNSFLTQFDQYLVNPVLSFSRKGFSTTVAYRFSVRNEGSPFVSLRHRVQLGMGYRHGFGDFRLGTKVRYQQVVFPIRLSERIPYGEARMTLRHKLDLKYTGEKKAQPFVAIEYFLPLDQGSVTIGRVRYRVGVSIDLPKRMGMSFYYTSEHLYTESLPSYIHTLGIFYSFAPKLKKKKKKK